MSLFNRKQKRCRGFSLLEMAMASTLVAGTLVPTIAIMRDAMAMSRDLNRRNLLANYAVSVLEAQTAVVLANWTSSTVTGNFTVDGHASIRYSAVRSDAPANGGLSDQLMHIRVTVFDDTDGDTTLDANELSVLFRTKVAKLQSYEDEE
jgi:hypothetical protein